MITERLSALRTLMQQHHLNAYIIRGTDPHADEYMADHWYEITFISGFKGETGTVLVTLNEAFLWTDSRYYLQAEKELEGTGISLMRESEIDTPTIPQWLAQNLHSGDTVGINPEMFTVSGYNDLRKELSTAGLGIYSIDLIRPLWINRPPIPQNPLYQYSETFAGESATAKIQRIREEMNRKHCDTLLISALDETAWLLNVRGSDIAFNPVAIAYTVLRTDSCHLFIDPQKLTAEAQAYLLSIGVTTHPYDGIFAFLQSLPAESRVLLDGSRVNQALYEALPADCKKTDAQSPVLLDKSKKTPIELEGERIAMRKDAVALTRFFKWLEEWAATNGVTNSQGTPMTEYDLMQQLHHFRAEQENFIEESFETIAGYAANGAIVHYEATADDCAVIHPTGMLLLDSGGQYLDGTTDITRTICFDEPTAQMKRDYTLVLKGHIALARAKFIRGTRGNQLDVLAHQFMWQDGIHYGHGTGHGVGHFLCCHEGPQNIRTDNNPAPLYLGNICSDEPGIYRAGEYGIRIENLITVIPAEKTDFGEFYQFETLTLCYYDTHLIDMTMMTPEEISWINAYHQRVAREICPLLTPDEARWLQNKCQPI